MAYAVRISRIAADDQRAVYEWESTAGPSGHVLLVLSEGLFRPSDAAGKPIGEMAVRIGDESVTSRDPETVQGFMTAVGGILRKWKRDNPPPETAHLYFG